MDAEFIKWPHLERLEDESDMLTRAFRRAEETEGWAVLEKLDGANLGIHVTASDIRLSSRRQLLAEGEDFYGVLDIRDQWEPLAEAVQGLLRGVLGAWQQISLHGELFGPGVMNRIPYGSGLQIRLFGGCSAEPDGEGGWTHRQWGFGELRAFLQDLGMERMLVPVLKEARCFVEAQAVPAAGPSLINPAAKREGIVLMPLNGGWRQWNGDCAAFKRKDEAFSEKPGKASERPLSPEEREIAALRDEFRGYCTESRMFSVASRIGRPESPKDFGRYAGPFLQDAWEDFLHDHPGLQLSKGGEKAVKNVGSLGMQIFRSVCPRLMAEGAGEDKP